MSTASPAPLVMDAAAVQSILPEVDTLGAMRALFTELGKGQAVQPSQTLTLFPEDKGDFITYQGASTGANLFGAKLSPYLVQPGKPVITAWTVLMSMDTGQPLLLCDSGELTTERTAGTTALAVDHLAKPGAAKLAIIGSGKVAQAHLRHTAALRDWSDIHVFSPSLNENPELQQHWHALDTRVQCAQSAEAAARDADVIMLCTSSGTPVLNTTDLPPATLVTSISTNVANAHEVDPAFLSEADVYCDYRATTPASAGDMKLATEAGWSADSIRGDLAELQTTSCAAPSGDKPVFFRSIGLGLEDIFMARAVYDAAKNQS
ncbi:ornithine cyclodeaminase family protein [Shimia sp. R11_0]|uniref:ornithine cyclodeaminase family protein n=1 Tax=Shimia sp. R11_0 TaxID=2821096 RepID=UPI001ADBC77E|nr:ornithine cyclodeaminase family protein [Shimia sp. R11_0]MBO9477274.1 ornithine cyclodeaminase family protein [Shimia sp. R11_0]